MRTFAYRAMLVLLLPAFAFGCALAAIWQTYRATRDLWREFWDDANHA